MITTGTINNLQATGLKYANSLKIIPLSPLSVLLALSLISGGLIGAYTLNEQNDDKVNLPGIGQTPNIGHISKEATATDNDINNFIKNGPLMEVGEYRNEAQDIQQRITDKWFDAGRASGLTEEEYNTNKKYIRFLSVASKVVTSIQEGEYPDTGEYRTLYKELTGKDSLVSL